MICNGTSLCYAKWRVIPQYLVESDDSDSDSESDSDSDTAKAVNGGGNAVNDGGNAVNDGKRKATISLSKIFNHELFFPLKTTGNSSITGAR